VLRIAYKLSTFASNPACRRACFGTTTGSNVPARTRGTSTARSRPRSGPSSASTCCASSRYDGRPGNSGRSTGAPPVRLAKAVSKTCLVSPVSKPHRRRAQSQISAPTHGHRPRRSRRETHTTFRTDPPAGGRGFFVTSNDHSPRAARTWTGARFARVEGAARTGTGSQTVLDREALSAVVGHSRPDVRVSLRATVVDRDKGRPAAIGLPPPPVQHPRPPAAPVENDAGRVPCADLADDRTPRQVGHDPPRARTVRPGRRDGTAATSEPDWSPCGRDDARGCVRDGEAARGVADAAVHR
jgi:hypothetical protein